MIAINEDFSITEENRALLLEAMAELEVDDRNAVKKVIKERLTEIKRLEFLLEKAKSDLAKLMQQEATAIQMLGGR